MKLEIIQSEGKSREFDFPDGIYTVGSEEECRIHLPHSDVDGRHAILSVSPEGLWIEDLDSKTGTTVDGQRSPGRREIQPGQTVSIGPYRLVVTPDAIPQAASKPPPALEPAMPADGETEEAQVTAVSEEGGPLAVKRAVKQQIHKELVDRLDIKRLSASRIKAEELRERAMHTVQSIVREVSTKLPPGIDPAALTKEICDEALGLGPLEEFLDDPDITEIMVNGPSHVYIEKQGRLIRTDRTFMDDASVSAIIERIVSPLGRRIDESQPYVDARLPDGSRVNAIISPLSLVGPCITIRKFSKDPFTDKDLIRFGTMSRRAAEFLAVCVKLRKNIIVSGGTGSGKTTLLNVLGDYLPSVDRIVTIEDAAELRLTQVHVVRLEARPPNIEGKGAVTIRDLVRNALRMRPDRIVVGECRGGEALDMLQAMNTGHDGSLTTVHANSPRDVISRLETMVLMSGMELPVRAIREQVASAIDVIVHVSRFSDGSRKIMDISEVVGLEGEQITMQTVFEYEQTGVDAKGNVQGTFHPTGSVPTFIDEVAARGLVIDRTMFDPLKWREEERVREEERSRGTDA